jgi:hypothetical protein
MSEMKDVPETEVGEVVQSFVDEGKTTIRATRQDDDDDVKWTIVAS